jgi:CBS domain-containing protein
MRLVNTPSLARDIMVTRLVTLSPGMDVYDAIGLLLKHKISGAPVVDADGRYLGVFSEKCCMSVLVKAAYDSMPTSQIDPFIDTEAHTTSEETDLLSLAQIFLNTDSRRLPVLRSGKLVGQISRRDVLKAAHKMLAVAPGKKSDLLYLSSIFDRNDAPIPQ